MGRTDDPSHVSPDLLTRWQLAVTRRLDGLRHGDHLGWGLGPGSEPGDSRPYLAGDDVRRMDWPLTARTGTAHVRQTIADRELTCWLVVDASASMAFGTGAWLKQELQLAAASAVVRLTARGGNRVGALVATGASPPRVLPPRTGRRAAQGLLRAVAAEAAPPDRSAGPPGPVDLAGLLDTAHRFARRRSLVVLISDFLAPPAGWAVAARRLGRRHDLTAVEIVDPRELSLPDVGVLELTDPETGEVLEVQTADPRLRQAYAEAAAAQRTEIAAALRRAGAATVRLRTDRDWLADLVRFVAAQRYARSRGAARAGAAAEGAEAATGPAAVGGVQQR